MNHIAFLAPTVDRLAGAERQVILLGQGLQSRGWRVSLVALSGDGRAARAELAAGGMDFLSLEMRKGLADPRGWMLFHDWLRQEGPEIVHAHLPHAAWMARWSRLLAPVPVLIDTIHTPDTGSLGRRLGYRLSGWLSDRTSAVSQGARKPRDPRAWYPGDGSSRFPMGLTSITGGPMPPHEMICGSEWDSARSAAPGCRPPTGWCWLHAGKGCP